VLRARVADQRRVRGLLRTARVGVVVAEHVDERPGDAGAHRSGGGLVGEGPVGGGRRGVGPTPTTAGRTPTLPAVLLLVGVLSVALGAAWALLDDVQRGVEVGVCALLAGAPVGYALAARLPLRVAVRR